MNEVTGRDFGRLEGKVDALMDMATARDERIADMTKDLSDIKKQLAFTAGRNSILSSIVGALSGGIVAYFGRHL